MFVPLSKCTKLSMSVDQAIKYIISAGLHLTNESKKHYQTKKLTKSNFIACFCLKKSN